MKYWGLLKHSHVDGFMLRKANSIVDMYIGVFENVFFCRLKDVISIYSPILKKSVFNPIFVPLRGGYLELCKECVKC